MEIWVRDLPYYVSHSALDADKDTVRQTKSGEGARLGRNCMRAQGIYAFGAGIQIFRDLHRG